MINIDELDLDETLKLLEGLTKKINKAKKNNIGTYITPTAKEDWGVSDKQFATDVADSRSLKPKTTAKRRSDHRRKRGVKKARESLLAFLQQAVSEAWSTKQYNKARKGEYENEVGNSHIYNNKVSSNMGSASNKASNKHAAYDKMATQDSIDTAGNKNAARTVRKNQAADIEHKTKNAKTDRKAKAIMKRRAHGRTGREAAARESLFGAIHNMITEEQADDIEQAGGSPEVFRATRKAKLAQRGVRKSKHISRKDALGKMGGRYKQDGTKADVHTKSGGEKNFSDDSKKTSGIPLNPKGKPKKGRSRGGDANVRGKTVNTSRSTGEEDRKAQANSDAFSDLVGNLSKNKR